MVDDPNKPFTENTGCFNIGNVLMIDAGVSPEQLGDALQTQAEHPQRKLGEILIDMGALPAKVLRAALAKQAKWRKKGPSTADVKNMADLAAKSTLDLADNVDKMLDETRRK